VDAVEEGQNRKRVRLRELSAALFAKAKIFLYEQSDPTHGEEKQQHCRKNNPAARRDSLLNNWRSDRFTLRTSQLDFDVFDRRDHVCFYHDTKRHGNKNHDDGR
jgi:hypothetical protein